MSKIWPKLPRRVLDLKQFTVTQHDSISQVQVVDGRDRHGPYVALSYQWPSRPHTGPCLTTENEQEFKHGIRADCMLKVAQDACLLTSRLGIRYLWIDSMVLFKPWKVLLLVPS